MKARSPTSTTWRRVGADTYTDGELVVVSTLEVIAEWQGVADVPQWYVSVSRLARDRRPSDREVRRVHKVFRMRGSEEDNHVPGVARHFWLVVDPALRVDCECKDAEDTLAEPDGFAWQEDKGADHEATRDEWARARACFGAKF